MKKLVFRSLTAIKRRNMGRFSLGLTFVLAAALTPMAAMSQYTGLPNGNYKFKQLSSAHYMDAYEGSKDYQAVIRPEQRNNTQCWRVTRRDNGYNIKQVSSNRFLDAHEQQHNDYRVVTRGWQKNNTQVWLLLDASMWTGANKGEVGAFRIIQKSTGRSLDARSATSLDNPGAWMQGVYDKTNIVTRPPQNGSQGGHKIYAHIWRAYRC